MNNPVRITEIDLANPNDNRGSTREWKLSGGIQITAYTRKKGSTSRHFHKGDDKSKNPERLFLIKGKMKIIFEVDGETQERILTAGTELTIYPPTRHEVEVLDDVVFIEYRVTRFDPEYSDTYSY